MYKISSHIQKLAVISCDLNVKRILRGALYQSAKSRDHQKAISHELSAALQGSGNVRIHSKPAYPQAIGSVLSNIGLTDMEKAVRLDILGTNTAAERLYTRCGFRFVQAKQMYYDDTGWTEYKYN